MGPSIISMQPRVTLSFQVTLSWCSIGISQNWTMQNKTSSHLPFTQLPVEARVLFFIYASAALARYRYQPPTMHELAPELEAAWTKNWLHKSDLSDPDRMTCLLEQHFAPSAPSTAKKRTSRCHAQESK